MISNQVPAESVVMYNGSNDGEIRSAGGEYVNQAVDGTWMVRDTSGQLNPLYRWQRLVKYAAGDYGVMGDLAWHRFYGTQ